MGIHPQSAPTAPGTGFPLGKGTPPAALDAQAQKVPVLGRIVIPEEKLLGYGADLYIDTSRRWPAWGTEWASADGTWTLMPRAAAERRGHLIHRDDRPSDFQES
ncbi:hypothetical protein [Streptomyces sp. NPDC050564]|uniref:hypothetical protein n=1 Tax=Streptomyces sp. NPDC050564 TaxID=3365631 RepID=UPI00379AE5E8